MTERSRLLTGYRDRILVWTSLAAILFALLGYLLVRHGLRPLRRLVAQTETVTVANLSARIEGAGVPRELMPVIVSFNAMLDRLDKGFTQLSQVSADMAHDLRTPINNLLGQTEVALGQRRTAEQYEMLLASNLEELQRLSRMTDNMLFLARSEQADAAIERRTLDVADELQRVADYFEGLAEERGLQIAVRGEGEIWADSMLLRRALANLMANAIRYAESGTAVSLQAERSSDGVTLTVENHGPTIEAHHLTRVFDRFYRADASRQDSAEASGLGLSIVRTIMTLHQGRWNAASEHGLTRFSLFFPGQSGPG
jgi:two-component system heavy metal sensor histidine kinase CusS